MLLFPSVAFRQVERFESSRIAASVLTVIGWFWTAWECDHIGIDVFDMLLKRFTGEVWILAAVLSYLTIIWMPKNLSVRALTGILMLMPALIFRTTRLHLPESGCGWVHLLVVCGYVSAIVGMYGMFYPWRLEKAVAAVFRRPALVKALGVLTVVWGALVIVAGVRLHG